MPRPLSAQSRVVHDVTSPEFPHGTVVGRSRGCERGANANRPCPAPLTCRQAAAVAAKKYRVANDRGVKMLVDATPALEHIAGLVARDPVVVTEACVLSAAKVHSSTISQLRTTGSGRLNLRIVDRILAVTYDQAVACSPWSHQEAVLALSGQLQALGYSVEWQGQRIGVGDLPSRLGFATRRGTVRVRRQLHEALVALHAEYGHREATPEDGLLRSAIGLSKTVARRRGFYPPAAYNDDGQLDLRLLPGHPWADADTHAGRALEALRDSLLPDPDPTCTIAERYGLNERLLLRLRVGLNVQFDQPRPGLPAQLRPESQAPARRLLEQIRQYEQDYADPVLTCLRLGVFRPAAFPKDHPAVVAFRQEQTPDLPSHRHDLSVHDQPFQEAA